MNVTASEQCHYGMHFREDKIGNAVRKIISIASTKTSTSRNINETDKFYRDTITVTANARNIGLDQ